ncbi:MAG: hypothetical protein KGI59_02970 [Patescibacteria group bacterium]|nr:hypothetical protein [Patescibacteria group bacterium]MDE2172795.1 hypothetical protein [Patescibacteria group bacterium]
MLSIIDDQVKYRLWCAGVMIGLVSVSCIYMRRHHAHKRRLERRCQECGSENVERIHVMRQLIGRTYNTSTRSRCLDCGAGRLDKPWRAKDFKWIDMFWRRLMYRRQFVPQHDGSEREHLQYTDGDFIRDVNRSVARQIPIADYFARRSRPPGPSPTMPAKKQA